MYHVLLFGAGVLVGGVVAITAVLAAFWWLGRGSK
jgi:hypothetical protein